MRKAKESFEFSPLFVDTEFIPSDLHYFTVYNPSISNTPSVLPYPDDQTTFSQLQAKLYGGKPEPPKKKSVIMDANIKQIKVKQCKKHLDGEEIQLKSKPVGLEELLNCKQRKERKERKEKCHICCVLTANKDEVIHLSFEWVSEQSTIKMIVEELNKRYKVKLNEDDIRLCTLAIKPMDFDGFTIFKCDSSKIKGLTEQIFSSSDSMAYLGIDITSNRIKASQFMSSLSKQLECERIIEVELPNGKSHRFNCRAIKQYQIKEILGILGVDNSQSKGIKVYGKVYQPNHTFEGVLQQFERGMVNFIFAEVVGQGEVLYAQIRNAAPLTDFELKRLYEEGLRAKASTKITPLMLFNSTCQVGSSEGKFKLLYHVVHKYIRNFFTHFFYGNAMSIRIIKGILEELQALPPYEGQVFRKVGYELRYKTGDIIQFSNFILTTTECQHIGKQIKTAYKSKETLVKIYSITGRQCSRLSGFQKLQEVVFLPFTKFEVALCDEDEQAIYLNLDEVPEKPQQRKNSIILWADNKQEQGQNIFSMDLKGLKSSVLLHQFKATSQLLTWIDQYKQYAREDQSGRLIVITNMKRVQKGKENPVAGINTVEGVRQTFPEAKIILYVGNKQYTEQNLRKYGIDPSSLDIINSDKTLANKIKLYCADNSPAIKSPKESTPLSKLANKVQTQNWQTYLSPHSSQSSIFIGSGGEGYDDWDRSPVNNKVEFTKY